MTNDIKDKLIKRRYLYFCG